MCRVDSLLSIRRRNQIKSNVFLRPDQTAVVVLYMKVCLVAKVKPWISVHNKVLPRDIRLVTKLANAFGTQLMKRQISTKQMIKCMGNVDTYKIAILEGIFPMIWGEGWSISEPFVWTMNEQSVFLSCRERRKKSLNRLISTSLPHECILVLRHQLSGLKQSEVSQVSAWGV